jgi:hypothetical protein
MYKCDECGTNKDLIRISPPAWAGYFLYRCVSCYEKIKAATEKLEAARTVTQQINVAMCKGAGSNPAGSGSQPVAVV